MITFLSQVVKFSIKPLYIGYEAYISCGCFWDSVIVPNLSNENINTIRKAVDTFMSIPCVKDAIRQTKTNEVSNSYISVDEVISEAYRSAFTAKVVLNGVAYGLCEDIGEAVLVNAKKSSTTDIIIPEKIDGCSVVSIDHTAFCQMGRVTSVVMPDSITRIGNVFSSCKNLTDIRLSNSIKEIEPYAFFNCISLQKIIIPKSVAKIEDNAFVYCSGLTDVTILNSNTEIGSKAFLGCNNVNINVVCQKEPSVADLTATFDDGNNIGDGDDGR